ncbi:MAG: hypothetical protein OEM52_13290, partial [bacterium]|nr:hypothetical protein [bacterium]
MKPLILAFLLLCATLVMAASNPATPTMPPTIDRQGGPDGYGYRYVDNQNEATGPRFEWVEIAAPAGGPGINTNLIRDDETIAVPLQGFSMNYYGTVYADSLTICSNGFVGFGLYSTFFENSQLPYTTHTQPCIYPLWDDLSLPNGGSVWYYYDQANERFIVEWYQVPQATVPMSRNTFQVRLYPTGVIEFLYHTIGSFANSSTVGIQGPNGGSSN